MDVDAAAQAIYETLAPLGHGPRPWAAHSPNHQPWATIPAAWQDEYRAAAIAALGGNGRAQGQLPQLERSTAA